MSLVTSVRRWTACPPVCGDSSRHRESFY